MRSLILLCVLLLLVPAIGHAQYDDPDTDLLNIEPDVANPDEGQIDIPLGETNNAKDAEAEAVTEQTLCCRMPDDVRESDELCADVECPEN